MAKKPTRRWIFAVLLAVLFPALAVHVSCVAVMGPGSWGSGMDEKMPELRAPGSNLAVAAYAREFAGSHDSRGTESVPAELVESNAGQADVDHRSAARAELVERIPAELLATLPGKVFWTDRMESENLTLIATHEGRTWTENQHFFLWPEYRSHGIEQGEGGQVEGQAEGQSEASPTGQGIRELRLGTDMILEQPTFMKRATETFVVVVRWRPWAVPPLEKLSRYLRSYADPTLRPEISLYLYALPDGPLEYWGPGHTLKASPDRRRAILLRSGALGAGYYSMHLWDFEQDRLTTIVSLRESDPGSGRSFDYAWSADSRAVHITGATAGFQRRRGEPRSLDLIYLVGDETTYDLALTE